MTALQDYMGCLIKVWHRKPTFSSILRGTRSPVPSPPPLDPLRTVHNNQNIIKTLKTYSQGSIMYTVDVAVTIGTC